MSSQLDLELRPAWCVGLLASLPWFTLGGLCAALVVAGNVWLLPALALALVGACSAIRCQGLLAGQRCVLGLSMRDDQLLARHRDGSLVAVNPGSCSRIGANFSVLQLRNSQNNRYSTTVLLLDGACGNVAADDARCLRLWLRLGARPVTDSNAV